jgi:hypothetical protein
MLRQQNSLYTGEFSLYVFSIQASESVFSRNGRFEANIRISTEVEMKHTIHFPGQSCLYLIKDFNYRHYHRRHRHPSAMAPEHNKIV